MVRDEGGGEVKGIAEEELCSKGSGKRATGLRRKKHNKQTLKETQTLTEVYLGLLKTSAAG